MLFAGIQLCNMKCILTIICLLSLLARVLCKPVRNTQEEEYPRYANYAVNDVTKDNKPQWRQGDSGIINSGYSLLGPDGSLRSLVEYNSEDFNGFTALLNSLAASLNKPLPLVDHLQIPLPPINPLIDPLNYGLGAAPLAVGVPQVTVSGSSIPWDAKTRSYGGWVPLRKRSRRVPYAKIVTKKYVNGHVYKVMTKSIPLTGKRIIVKRRPESD